MLTRCPNCGTTFRLRTEQLGQAEGRVRCGKCSIAFSAVEHRIDAEWPEAPMPAPPAEASQFPPLPAAAAHFSALGHRKRFVAQPEAAGGESTESGDRQPSEQAGPEQPNPPAETAEAAQDEPVAEPSELADEQTAEQPKPVQPPTEQSQPEQPKPEQQPPVSPDEAMSAQDAGRAAATYLIAAEPGSEPAPAQPLPVSAAAPVDSGEPAGREAAVPASDYLAAPVPARKWPLAVIAALFGVILIVQIGYGYRTELAKAYPGLRPTLEGACAPFGCVVELPRDAERVSIESSDLVPGSDKRYLQLAATLKNRAGYPQVYPHLELTLTDVRDQPLVRRVFTPAEYLAKDAAPSFGPNSELVIRLNLEADGLSASGYRVYLFYP